MCGGRGAGRGDILLSASFHYYIIGHLPSRHWPPLQPPFHFPSDLGSRGSDQGWVSGGEGKETGFEQVGEMDLEGIPHDEPLHVKDLPALEDQGHEDEVMGGGGTLQREEL